MKTCPPFSSAGRAFVFNAYTGYPVEIFLQYPAEAASTHWHQSPDPQQQQLQLQQQWEQQQQQLWQQQQQQYHAQQWQEGSGCPGPLLGSDASGLPPKPDPYMLLRESGLESLLGSDSWEAGRAFLALLYPRFRCRVCAWRCGSKPELATHVAAHRAAAGGAAAAASVDELQAAHAAAPSTRAIALAGRGPVSESPAGGEPGGAAPSWSRDWLREVAEPLPDEPSAGAVAGSGGDP